MLNSSCGMAKVQLVGSLGMGENMVVYKCHNIIVRYFQAENFQEYFSTTDFTKQSLQLFLLSRAHNFRCGGEYPTFYTAAKHTALSYDTIRC